MRDGHMSRPELSATLEAWLRENAPDCGDNSCLFGGRGKGGMRTNGGCRCFRDVRPAMKRIFIERLWAAFVQSEIERIAGDPADWNRNNLKWAEAEPSTAPSAPSAERFRGQRMELSIDGDHACALIGPNLQEGEACFVKIVGWPKATYKQEHAAMSAAYEGLAKIIGHRPPFDIVRAQ